MTLESTHFSDPDYFQKLLERIDTVLFRSLYFHPLNCTEEDGKIFAEAWEQHENLWKLDLQDLLVLMKIPYYAASLQGVVFEFEKIFLKKRYSKKNDCKLIELSKEISEILSEKGMSDEEPLMFKNRWEKERGVPKGYCNPLIERAPELIFPISYLKWGINANLATLRSPQIDSLNRMTFTFFLNNITKGLAYCGSEFQSFTEFCSEFPAPPMPKQRVREKLK